MNPMRRRPTVAGTVTTATVLTTGAAVTATAVHYGIPLWLLPIGACPALVPFLAGWLVNQHATNYARAVSRTTARTASYRRTDRTHPVGRR